MYLTLPNIEPFWLCFNIRSTAIQCLQFVYRPNFLFINIPIPCYIFIKQMSLLNLYLRGRGDIYVPHDWSYITFNSFYAYTSFFLFVPNAVVLSRVFRGRCVDKCRIGNYTKNSSHTFPFR
jgi:hypothetical protein